MPQLKVISLHLTYFDLGIFANRLIATDSLSHFLSDHLYLTLVPLYYIAKIFNSEIINVLLLIQSLFILLAGFIFFKFYERKVFYCFVLSYPVWYALLFDFHVEPIVACALVLYFYSVERGAIKYALLSLLLCAMSKEIYILLVPGGVLYLYIHTRNIINERYKFIYPLFLALLIVTSISIFVASYMFLSNNSASSNVLNVSDSGYAWVAKSLNISFYDFICDSLIRLLDPSKYIFIILLIMITGASVIYSYSEILVIVPVLIIYLLSDNPLHTKFNSHYAIVLAVPFIVSFSYALKKPSFNKINRCCTYFFIALSIILSPAPWSFTFLTDFSWQYGISAYMPVANDIKKNMLIDNYVMESDIVSSQNTVVNNKLVNRKYIYVFPEHIISNVGRGSRNANVVILDLNTPIFIGDTSCRYRFGRCTDPKVTSEFYALYNKLHEDYYVQAEHNGFYIFRSKGS